jgi:hypothetical protein
MADPIMYQEDGYVVLEADREEQFMTAEELQQKLEQLLASSEVEIPRELTKFDSISDRASYLRDNYFELDIGENKFLQWYVVRLNK